MSFFVCSNDSQSHPLLHCFLPDYSFCFLLYLSVVTLPVSYETKQRVTWLCAAARMECAKGRNVKRPATLKMFSVAYSTCLKYWWFATLHVKNLRMWQIFFAQFLPVFHCIGIISNFHFSSNSGQTNTPRRHLNTIAPASDQLWSDSRVHTRI